nr:TrkA family potassium uptake protein [Desulfuribacillus stibiiarsenatis]
MKQFAVLGLGRFGSSIAKTLYDMGHEVLAIDNSEEKVQAIANMVTQAVQADSTDEKSLKALGIRNFPCVVIAIGQDIQASIMATLIVKEMGVEHIVVKAQNPLHGKVLEKIGAHRIVYPERDMGYRVAHNLLSPNILDYIELSPDYSILEFVATSSMIGKTIKDLNIRAEFGINIMAIKSEKDAINVAPRAEDLIHEDDVLVVVGHNDDLREFEGKMAE